MAKTRELPLYNTIYGYTRDIYRIKIKLPKSLKHDLGQGLSLSAIKLLQYVVLANRSHDKALYLEKLLLQTEVQWALLRLAFDLRGISVGEFKILSEKLTEIGKQTQAWLNWSRKRKTLGRINHFFCRNEPLPSYQKSALRWDAPLFLKLISAIMLHRRRQNLKFWLMVAQ